MAKQFILQAISNGLASLKLPQTRDQLSEIAISVFIAFCCFCQILVCNPSSPLRDTWLAGIHPLLDYVSLLPRYHMFSPEAPTTNWTLLAEIKFADGTVKTWRYPQLNDYRDDFWLPQVKVRYQYWRAYTMTLRKFPKLQHGCAVYAARCNYNPANPPREVKLFLVSQDILLPGEKRENTPVKEELFDYTVDPSEL